MRFYMRTLLLAAGLLITLSVPATGNASQLSFGDGGCEQTGASGFFICSAWVMGASSQENLRYIWSIAFGNGDLQPPVHPDIITGFCDVETPFITLAVGLTVIDVETRESISTEYIVDCNDINVHPF